MISFTIDTDWVNDHVLEYSLDIFARNSIKCTVFATHKTSLLNSLDKDQFEIAIHPNFNKLLENNDNSSPNKLISNLLNIYPDSIGVRVHSLLNSTYLSDNFKKNGLKYESNILLPYQDLIPPFKLWNGLYRTSFNWEDDIHMLYNKSFENIGIDILKKDIIFNFHPIHIFLNTESINRYKLIKKGYKDTNFLIRNINSSKINGVNDLLIKSINKVKENNLETCTLSERFKNLLINVHK